MYSTKSSPHNEKPRTFTLTLVQCMHLASKLSGSKGMTQGVISSYLTHNDILYIPQPQAKHATFDTFRYIYFRTIISAAVKHPSAYRTRGRFL